MSETAVFTKFWRVIDRLVSGSVLLSGASLVAVVSVIFLEVVMRKLGFPSSWALALSTYLQAYLVFLGLAWVQKIGGNVTMELLIRHLPPKLQFILEVLTSVIVLVMAAVLAWQGTVLAWQSVIKNVSTFGEVLIPVIYAMWTVPAGLILLSLVCLLQTIHLITALIRGDYIPQISRADASQI